MTSINFKKDANKVLEEWQLVLQYISFPLQTIPVCQI